MKTVKFICIGLLLFAFHANVYSQAKKPTIMIMPEWDWCRQHGYVKTFDNQGSAEEIPDYDAAFKNEDLRSAITTLEGMMTERGFPLEGLRSSERHQRGRSARRAARTRTASSNPIDELLRTAKADIIMELSWNVKSNGPETKIGFLLTGRDAYTDKSIATGEGDEVKSTASDVGSLLRASVLNHIDNFNAQLMTHFEGILNNGREITFSIEAEEGALPDELDTRFDGQALSRIIRKWVSDNTVNGNFSIESSSETFIDFDQVRIPVYGVDEMALDAEEWSEGLLDMLEDKYKLKTKKDGIGLGRIEILIIK
jgi:hypothetical protein